MTRHLPFVLLLTFLLSSGACSQEVIRLSGIVSDRGGNPVEGALVSLLGKDLRDTTEETGIYSLIRTANGLRMKRNRKSLPRTQSDEVVFYQPDGRRVQSDVRHPGSILIQTRGTLIRKVIIDQPGTAVSYASTTTGSSQKSVSSRTVLDTVGTLEIVHPDYKTQAVSLTSLVENIDITLLKDTPNTAVIVTCDQENRCGLDCSEYFISVTATASGMDTVRATGISTDTIWMYVPVRDSSNSTGWLFTVDVFCMVGPRQNRLYARVDVVDSLPTNLHFRLFEQNCSKLSLIYPKGGETFRSGEPILVQWCIPTDWPYDQVRILSDSSGYGVFDDITNYPLNVPVNGFLWRAPEVSGDASFRVRIIDYEQTPGVESTSENFTIVP